MATDIMDKDLKALRNARWETAFSEQPAPMCQDNINRKATIVIEHLIQASDVSHTMQHWHVYRKWNERLFAEMYKAYKEGRMDKDPAENWYQGKHSNRISRLNCWLILSHRHSLFSGEIGFFDFYIIPLAKKLADCGVFGVSSFQYLGEFGSLSGVDTVSSF